MSACFSEMLFEKRLKQFDSLFREDDGFGLVFWIKDEPFVVQTAQGE
jgi:hypothetical protein